MLQQSLVPCSCNPSDVRISTQSGPSPSAMGRFVLLDARLVHLFESGSICCLQLDDLQHVQCGQAPLADSSLGQSAPSQAQFSHLSTSSRPSGKGSGSAAPAAHQLPGPKLTSSSQPRSSGASASQSTPSEARGSGDAATQPTPAAGSGSVQVGQRRGDAGSGGGSSAGSRSQPGPQSSAAAGIGTDRGCPPGACHSDSLLSLQLTRSPVPAPSLQPLPTWQSFPTPQLAQRPPSQLSQVQTTGCLPVHLPCHVTRYAHAAGNLAGMICSRLKVTGSRLMARSSPLHADAPAAIRHAADGVAGGAVLLSGIGAAEPAARSAAAARRSADARSHMDPAAPNRRERHYA